MIIVRLFAWAFRLPILPTADYRGQRPPTFGEALTGVSRT